MCLIWHDSSPIFPVLEVLTFHLQGGLHPLPLTKSKLCMWSASLPAASFCHPLKLAEIRK